MNESLYTKIIGDSAPTSATNGVVGQWYLDTTTGKLYECKAVDTTVTPNTYTWSEVGGGSTMYAHKIMLSGTTGAIYIETTSSTPFTTSTLANYLYNLGYTTSNTQYYPVTVGNQNFGVRATTTGLRLGRLATQTMIIDNTNYTLLTNTQGTEPTVTVQLDTVTQL